MPEALSDRQLPAVFQAHGIAFHKIDVLPVEDIGFVDAKEIAGGQFFFETGQGPRRQVKFAFQPDFDVVAVAFQVENIRKADLDMALVHLDEYLARLVPGWRRELGRGGHGTPFQLLQLHCFVDGFQETAKPERLQQVIAHIQIEAFQGVFFVGGSDDDDRGVVEGSQKIKPFDLRHDFSSFFFISL